MHGMPGRFETTRWSLVRRAGQSDGKEALAVLCQRYWQPVYSFIRTLGVPQEDAADVTQAFFCATLLERNDIASIDSARGKFRTWLRACARNYVNNWFDHKHRAVHGGKAIHVDIDCAAAEEWLISVSKEQLTPDRLYDRCWALNVINRSLVRLRTEYSDPKKQLLLSHYESGLAGEGATISDRDLSALLGKSPGAVKSQRSRMLHEDFKRHLRAEVGETVRRRQSIDEEIRNLIDALD